MRLLIFLLALSLTACKGGGSSAAAAPDGGNPGVTPQAVVVTVKTGQGFECFSFTGSIWCRGVSLNADINLNSPATFTEYVTDSNSDILALETWDDTICWSSLVTTRPVSRGTGNATYCIGEATLAGSYAGYPVVYGGPNYSTAVNGSADLTYASEPFMGGDITMTDLLNSTIMTDGSGSVSATPVNCLWDGTELDCGTFEVVP